MELLFELDQYSDYGPQVAYVRVEIEGNKAQITGFDREVEAINFESIPELLKYVSANYKDNFMTTDESELLLEATPEIEKAVRELLWPYEGEI